MKKSKKLFALAMAVVMTLSLLASCTTGGTTTPSTSTPSTSTPSTSNPSTSNPSASTPSTPATPKRTDLNMPLISAGVTMDPHNSGQNVDLVVEYQIYEGLIALNWDTSEVMPRIAESWTISEDGKTYTFKIRQGVKFHNGDTLTVDDVVFSIQRAQTSTQAKTYVGFVDTVEAKDATTVVINMTQPFSAFLQYLNMVKIVSKKVVTEQGEAFGTNATDAGTGPYKLVSYDRNTKIVLEKFDDYYGTPANIKTVNYHVITDSSTRTTALKTGQLDFIGPAYSEYNDFASSGEFNVGTHDTPNIRYLCMNPMNPDSPLYDKRVRQAIQMVLEKQQIVDIAVSGFGTVADQMMKAGAVLGAPTNSTWTVERNVEKAKQLLAEAGYPNGCYIGTIQCATATFAVVCQVIQEQLKEVGITCDIVQGQTSTMLPDWRAGKYDLIMNAINPVITYDSYRTYNDYTREAVFVKYDRNPETDHLKINDLFDRAAAAPTEKEMMALYAELDQVLTDAACWTPLWYNVNVYAWAKDLNAQTYAVYYNLADWSWN